jgi:hypothetical protein
MLVAIGWVENMDKEPGAAGNATSIFTKGATPFGDASCGAVTMSSELSPTAAVRFLR